MRIAVVVGTRPEFIKTWSVVREIKERSDLDLLLIHTGQHYDYEMSQVFFEELNIEKPDFFLEVGSLLAVDQTAALMKKLSEILKQEKVDIVLVQGDTNSCMSTAIVAIQLGIPLGHIEAGCRSFDRTMPEELNRLVIDSIANLLFAPSQVAFQNLMREGHNKTRVVLAGNTAVDALDEGLRLLGDSKGQIEGPYCIATIHRAANTDNPNRLREILTALNRLPMKCIFPIHPRTKKMVEEFGMEDLLSGTNLDVIAPLGYLSFLNLLRNSNLILTDSGGVQEEAALLGINTITIRENTEWPETLWKGINHLSHADSEEIVRIANSLTKINSSEVEELYYRNAGKKIIDVIVDRASNRGLGFVSLDMLRSGYPVIALTDKDNPDALLRFDKDGNAILEGKVERALVEKYKLLEKE